MIVQYATQIELISWIAAFFPIMHRHYLAKKRRYAVIFETNAKHVDASSIFEKNDRTKVGRNSLVEIDGAETCHKDKLSPTQTHRNRKTSIYFSEKLIYTKSLKVPVKKKIVARAGHISMKAN